MVGNHERPSNLGEFEVYLRGLGFKNLRDHYDRFFLYRKSQTGVFPDHTKIVDKLICIILLYGDTNKVALEQQEVQQLYQGPPAFKKQHDHPCDLPENIKKQPAIGKTIK